MRCARHIHMVAERLIDPGPAIAVAGHAPMSRPRVLVIGCGFGGIEAVRALSKATVEITLVDRTNHHLFQPLLYQVATAGLSAPAVSAPIRHVLRRQMKRGNLTILKAEVQAIDVAGRSVTRRRRRAHRLGPPDRRRRRHPQLLRPRRMGGARPGPEDAGRRLRHPRPRHRRLRAGRAGEDAAEPRRLDDLRRHRRRPDRASRWPGR